MQQINWGIIGCGGIAHRFVTSLNALDSGRLQAVASRTPDRALEFAKQYGPARHYSDYESLAADPDIHAVYIATTHNFHYENIRLCLEHGKHVLCEKPLTINAAQVRDLVKLAGGKKLFLMEALWTRFLPSILKLKELLSNDVIGEVQTVFANFCILKDVIPEHRLRNVKLAGGALLDLGIYPISMADVVFDEKPSRMLSSAKMDPETGVDEYSYFVFEYGSGRRAVLSASYSQSAPIEALVCGTKGFIRIPHFLGAKALHVHRAGQEPEVLEFPFSPDVNFKYEIAHAMKCILSGKTESEIMPLSKTLGIMEIMDALRSQWNLVYPGE